MDPETSFVRSAARRHPIRILAASAALLVFAVFLLVLSVFQARRPSSTLRQNGFLGPNASAVFDSAGNGLAVSDGSRISLYAPSGSCVAYENVSMAFPACAGGSLLAVFYDTGERGICALYPDGICRTADTDGSVVFADVNETGLITVIWENTDRQGTAMVYDTDLTPLFRWDCGNSLPLMGRTSGEDLLCVSSMDHDGSYIHYFRIDRPEEQIRLSFPGEILTDFDFLSDRTLAMISEKRLILADSGGNLISSMEFGEHRPEVWSLNGEQAAVYMSSETGGSLVSVASDGRILGSCPAPSSVSAISVQREILVLFEGGESTLYDRDLTEIVSYQPDRDTTQVFLSPNGMAFFSGPSGVTLADFGR